MSHARHAILRLLSTPWATAMLAPFRSGRAAVFMLHRFTDPSSGIVGHDPDHVRAVLRYLQGAGYEFVSLSDLFRRLEGGAQPLSRAVSFTIDDGYREHATVAAPLFAEFGCPVTTFVVTGFLDRDLWCWWDRVEYVMRRAKHCSVRVTVGATQFDLALESSEQRVAAQIAFTEACKRTSDSNRKKAIGELAAAAEVELPAEAPPPYQPMTWVELRAAERQGMTFGPHTVTHPILSQTPDTQACAEIRHSWHRLQQEASRPVPIFCYPNGQLEDFGTREMECLRELKFLGAVAVIEDYADSRRFSSGPLARYQVRRFAFPASLPQVIQTVSGFERVKQVLRGQR